MTCIFFFHESRGTSDTGLSSCGATGFPTLPRLPLRSLPYYITSKSAESVRFLFKSRVTNVRSSGTTNQRRKDEERGEGNAEHHVLSVSFTLSFVLSALISHVSSEFVPTSPTLTYDIAAVVGTVIYTMTLGSFVTKKPQISRHQWLVNPLAAQPLANAKAVLNRHQTGTGEALRMHTKMARG